jgi:hypothetical protein
VRHYRNQSQQRDATPATAFDVQHDRPQPGCLCEVDQARVNVTGDQETCGCAGKPAQLCPNNAPGNAKKHARDNREQGARNKQQAGDEMGGKEP